MICISTGAEGIVHFVLPNGTIRVRFNPHGALWDTVKSWSPWWRIKNKNKRSAITGGR